MKSLPQFYTILTRGHTAHVFVWQPVPSRWLRFDPETPGIRYVATVGSVEAAKRIIARDLPGFQARVRLCFSPEAENEIFQ